MARPRIARRGRAARGRRVAAPRAIATARASAARPARARGAARRCSPDRARCPATHAPSSRPPAPARPRPAPSRTGRRTAARTCGRTARCPRAARAAAGSESGRRSAGRTRSSRKRPAFTSAARSRLVAATSRTSTVSARPPTCCTSPDCSARRIFAWIASGSSPISSMNSVPLSACWKYPWPRLRRARERPLRVPEQLRLRELARNRRRVEPDERLVRAARVRVERRRHHVLPRSRSPR